MSIHAVIEWVPLHFQLPPRCSISPVLSYALEVVQESSGNNKTANSTTSFPGAEVTLELDDLIENVAYNYSIVAINEIGRSTTASISFRKFNENHSIIII